MPCKTLRTRLLLQGQGMRESCCGGDSSSEPLVMWHCCLPVLLCPCMLICPAGSSAMLVMHAPRSQTFPLSVHLNSLLPHQCGYRLAWAPCWPATACLLITSTSSSSSAVVSLKQAEGEPGLMSSAVGMVVTISLPSMVAGGLPHTWNPVRRHSWRRPTCIRGRSRPPLRTPPAQRGVGACSSCSAITAGELLQKYPVTSGQGWGHLVFGHECR